MGAYGVNRMDWLRPFALGLLAASMLVAGSGCKNTNFLSTKDEVKLGKDASEEIEHRYKVDAKSEDCVRVRTIGARIAEHSDARPGVPYSYKVLDIKDVNAVSLPGGPVYVYRGLMDLVGKDDDALACIIAHETGHIDARHAAKQISQEMLANVGISIILKGGTAQNIGALASDLMSLHYSRDDEYEADMRGLSYAKKAGFNPVGMVRFFKKLEAMEKKGGKDPELLRTHPLTRNRIVRVEKAIETENYRYGR